MLERRKYVRVYEKAEITYIVIPALSSKQYITSDISQGGIRFFVHNFIPKDSYLKIRIVFSKSNVVIEAVVRLQWIKQVPYSDRYEVGVRFIDISPKAADHLSNYIRSFMTTQAFADPES
jgi:c-di-GMP-binding flagellar brake protein YcgR